MDYLIYILIAIAAFVLGFCTRAATNKSKDGVLKIDTSGEKDIYTFELWTALQGLEKRKEIRLKIEDISQEKPFL